LNTIPYNFGIAALSRLLLGGISLIIVGFLTRNLGPAGYGQYSLILAYLYIFSSLADMGLNTILVREISRDGADEKYISDNIFTLRLVLIVGFCLIGIFLALTLNYPIEVKFGIAIASIYAVLSSLGQVMIGIFQKYLRIYFVSLADVIARAVQLAIVLVLVLTKPTLLNFIWAVVLSEVAHFALIFFFSRRIIKVKMEFDLKYWRKIFVTALPIAISLVFVLLYFKMDTVLLSLMKPAYDVGVYSAAYKVLEAIIFLPALYIGLVMPVLSRHAFGNREEFLKAYRRSFDVLAIFAIPIMCYLYLRAADIINLIGGRDFGQSVGVLKVLSVAIMLIFFGNLAGNALVALNLQKKGVWVYMVGAVFNVGANLVLIPRYSFMATAWTTVLTELLITFLLFWLIKKQTQATVRFSIAVKSILAAAITCLALSFGHFHFIVFSLLSLVYFPILYLFGGFTIDDFKTMLMLRPPRPVIE